MNGKEGITDLVRGGGLIVFALLEKDAGVF